MVMVEFAWPIPMPAPALMLKEPLEPFRLVTTEGRGAVLALIVIVPLPAPMLTMPAPE